MSEIQVAEKSSEAQGQLANYTSFCAVSSNNIPDSPQVVKKLGIPLGVLFSPFPEIQPPLLRRSAARCDKCGAYANCYSVADFTGYPHRNAQWNCVFCGSQNAYLPGAGGINLGELSRSDFLDLTYQVVDYLDPTNQPLPMGQVDAPAYIFVLDANIQEKQMSSITSSIAEVISKLPDEARIGFLMFSNYISLYEMTTRSFASCEVYSGTQSPNDKLLQTLHDSGKYLVELKRSREAATTILKVLSSQKRATQANPQRALGVAIQYALGLIQGSKGDLVDNRYENAVGGKVFVMLSGCPNCGPGGVSEVFSQEQEVDYRVDQATQFYRKQAALAATYNFSIDIYCIGLKTFRVRLLQHLVLSNGGTVVLIKDAEDSQLGKDLVLSVFKTLGRSGSFSLVTSQGIGVSHIIGPAIGSSSKLSETSGPNHCVVAAVQSDISFAVFYYLEEELLQDSIHFQFVLKFINHSNQRIIRVITQKVHTCGQSAEEFLKSIHPEVLSVLQAKKLVLEARKQPLHQLESVVAKLDKFVKQIQKWKTSLSAHVVQVLEDIPWLMFSLRRGPLLGPILQHPDDIDYSRCLFLQAPLDVCARFLRPPFLRISLGDVQQMPLEVLALQSHNVLLLDHHTDILIWYGNAVGEHQEQLLSLAQQIAEDRAALRFPQPYIMKFRENTSMARWLLCRLIPSHKDNASFHFAHFPELATLPKADYDKFLSKFHYTDDLSFLQYLAQLPK